MLESDAESEVSKHDSPIYLFKIHPQFCGQVLSAKHVFGYV